jgi:hypothetical protein
MPPDVLCYPRGLAESGLHAAVVLMNPRLGLTAPVVPSNLRDVDAKIDREQTVQVLSESRDVGCARRIRCAQLNADDLGEAVFGATIECPP